MNPTFSSFMNPCSICVSFRLLYFLSVHCLAQYSIIISSIKSNLPTVVIIIVMSMMMMIQEQQHQQQQLFFDWSMILHNFNAFFEDIFSTSKKVGIRTTIDHLSNRCIHQSFYRSKDASLQQTSYDCSIITTIARYYFQIIGLHAIRI